MLQVTPIKYDCKNHKSTIRTHILHPQNGVKIILIIESEKPNIISILEDHILETLSGTDWTADDMDQDFTFVTETYNRFIHNLDGDDLHQTSVLFAAIKNNTLTISAIGNSSAYLLDSEEVSEITTPER